MSSLTTQDLQEGTSFQINDVDKANEDDAGRVQVQVEALIEGSRSLVVQDVGHW